MRKKLIAAAIVLVIALGAGGWLLRGSILARYHVGRLDSDEAAIERVAAVGEPAVPRLLELLRQDTAATPRAGKSLARMLEQCPRGDPRCVAIASRIADSFGDFSPAGKQVALQIAESLPACGAREAAAAIIRAALKDGSAPSQDQAILIAVRPEFNLSADVVPLLSDRKPEIRRSALLAVGTLKEVVSDEDLLPSLHDPDADVRGLCEATLRGRGLRDKDIQLGKLVTDPSPLKRLEVLLHLPVDAELDPRLWVQKLCQDPSPLVRASAARFAMEPGSPQDSKLTDRVREMAQHDPDGTVRQIAEFLIQSQQAERIDAAKPH